MRHSRSIDLVPEDADPASSKDYEGLTFDTLRQWEILGARCSACQREAWFHRGDLEARYGNQYLMTLMKRLTCKHCGNREANRFVVGKMKRD
jgi:hypothetical protein